VLIKELNGLDGRWLVVGGKNTALALQLDLNPQHNLLNLNLQVAFKMNRIFGSRTAKPKPNLSDAILSTEARADGVEVKIKKLDAELSRYRDQMKKMKDGPGKVSYELLISSL